MRLSPGKFLGMKRLSDNNGIFLMTAVDQRASHQKPIADYLKKSEAPWKDVANFKKSSGTITGASSAFFRSSPCITYFYGYFQS